jgi:hypothetical protein
VWNHHIRRAVRFWTATDGLDVSVVDSLAAGRLEQLPVTEPRDDQPLVDQLIAERAGFGELDDEVHRKSGSPNAS